MTSFVYRTCMLLQSGTSNPVKVAVSARQEHTCLEMRRHCRTITAVKQITKKRTLISFLNATL